MSTRVAAFDFDGTLTARDTILPFLRGVSGATRFAAGLPRTLPVLCAHVLGRLDPTDTKEALFLIYLRGRRSADVQAARMGGRGRLRRQRHRRVQVVAAVGHTATHLAPNSG